MKASELQQEVVDILNGLDALLQGGCKAFAENARTVYDESQKHVTNGCTALVVVTPEMNRNGCDARGIPADTELQVQCSEKPALLRAQGREARLTALDAADVVMRALDGARFSWAATRQTLDRERGILTAIVTFNTSVIL